MMGQPHTDPKIMIQYSTRLPAAFTRIVALGTITLMGLMSAGCEDSSRVDGVAWNRTSTEAPVDENTPGDPAALGSAGDMVPFGALNWTYGGEKCSGAGHSGVTISGLSMNANALSFKYNTDLSVWGISHGDTGNAWACLFVKNNAGQWVGGKMDWISSSRTSRDYHNVYGGYNGWTLHDVPNPCEAAFVIVHKSGKKRSNVITTTWRR